MAAVLFPARPGILLNPSPATHHASLPFPSDFKTWPKRSPRYQTAPLPTMSYPPSSSSSTQSSPRSGPRKIRFAPLPDPRRSVLVTDDGEELPLPRPEDDDDDDADLLTPPDELPTQAGEWAAIAAVTTTTESPIQATTPLASSWSKASSSPYPGTTPLPYDAPPTPKAAETDASSVLGKARRALMKPLLTFPSASKESATPASSAPASAIDARFGSLDDLRTFGTGLFRPESRESTSGRGSRASSRERVLADDFGAPLTRTQSSSSGKRPVKRPPSRSSLLGRLGRSSTSSKTAPVSPATPTNAAPRTIRMLNGHVYGQKKKHAVEQKNLFATARADETFVEWGYGGAGSVKNAKELGVSSHQALQGKSSVTEGHGDDEEDDGSGATWLRKRREAREREAARLKAAAAAAEPPPAIEESEEQIDESTPATPAAVPSPAAKPEAPTPLATELSQKSSQYSAESTSYTHTPLCMPASHWNGSEKTDEGARTPSSESSGDSGSPSRDEESSPDNTSLENGEDEDQGMRKTSLGASVEIVSRHREKQ